MTEPETHLRSYNFRREREDGWRDLDSLVQRVQRSGLANLSAQELRRLPELYRSVISSLSVARSISLDRNVLAYLESGEDAATVKRMATQLQKQGVTTVPFFIFNRKLVASGAQSPAVLGAAMLQAIA